MVLEIGRKYWTRNGSIVEIDECNPDYIHSFGGIILYSSDECRTTGEFETYSADGRVFKHHTSILDLVVELNEVGELLFI